jgi:hypothetical protein
VENKNFFIREYGTKTFKIYFYFPEEGEFHHYPSIAYKNDVILKLSEQEKLNVHKKEVISEVRTFKDLMKSIENDGDKRQ